MEQAVIQLIVTVKDIPSSPEARPGWASPSPTIVAVWKRTSRSHPPILNPTGLDTTMETEDGNG